ncbi:hypothetical protein [Microbulbifer litoralis]|uniref:hypothetical protein n=1 Tax=Microbulbifer litoralis TaxID=2933965 RepID=UPI002028D7A5|nr:hypothetical protein [Microbulbifer sp. GX H0434]
MAMLDNKITFLITDSDPLIDHNRALADWPSGPVTPVASRGIALASLLLAAKAGVEIPPARLFS